MQHYEIAIVGGGLAGQVAALALGRAGRKVCLIAASPKHDDGRTTALMDQSVRYLERLGVWDRIAPSSAALSVMQILDGTNRLLRAPPAQFRASDIGLHAFGYNIPNKALAEVLDSALATEPNLSRIETNVESIALTADKVTIAIDGGEVIEADFVIGADGRKSITREAAGIDVRKWSYQQSALVLNFAHTLPHGNVSTEFHTESGPFTQVPLPGSRSSLVWVVRPEEASRLTSLPTEELSKIVEARMQSILGKVTVEGKAQAWPLSSMMAERFGAGRVALIGEAAHAFPPIGAQGLNLSLRDSMTLADLLSGQHDRPIPADAGDRYNRRRKPDVMSRTFSVDLLNRSLLTDLIPVQMVRAAGMHVLNAVSPLRNALMQEGVEPGRSLKNFVRELGKQIRR
ncbi:2-octaprenyl-6-methoxyphenol hydroxylase [Rhizobium wenxiniae]|uniref:2-octaprenyl-6-methoxyphenol hydroxylase n=1 Tax=Rhizobium wenxiniae TaxID=1737357 RepID=A0A7X0CXX0_9HYPH|nr:UbiH/UbiF family hydroxylase [Rhizobium wenxiniae]MBB6160660.1 2-octaprenyl-6-methoxyphenol hydroxylase [Rhizobium wenxiniae]GGF83165.1 2-octaprenyl-6-methoxyphenol hydroxylase [Rhizobium wenxiniae]